jgi:hypothetical protein
MLFAVIRPWWLAVARLTGLLAGTGLATSRLGLVAHELVGHGGFAIACGGEITEARLFWFAGGWIQYKLAEPSNGAVLAISLGGIIVETVIGLALWFALARKDTLARRVCRGIGAALMIHAGWYLATGTWHGYGDGVLIHRELGSLRYPVAIATGLVACGIAFAGARLVLGALAASLPGTRGARIAGMAIAVLVAGALQVGLAVGEVRVRGDNTYGAIMKPERERLIARELAEWQREQARLGAQISDAERDARARALAEQHRELPFAPVLAVLLAAAVALGAARARGAAGAVSTRLVAITVAVAAGSIATVIALDAAFH